MLHTWHGGEPDGKTQGFTLIELLVVAALLACVMTAVLAFSPLSGMFWQRSAAMVEAHQHLRVAMEELVHELQYAHLVNVDVDMQLISYQKQVNGELKGYQVYLLGSQLLIKLPEGTAVPLAGCIDGFWAEPEGLLPEGQQLTLKVFAAQEGYSVGLQTCILPRNVGGGL